MQPLLLKQEKIKNLVVGNQIWLKLMTGERWSKMFKLTSRDLTGDTKVT